MYVRPAQADINTRCHCGVTYGIPRSEPPGGVKGEEGSGSIAEKLGASR